MVRCSAVIGVLIGTCATGLAAQDLAVVDSLALARQYTEWLYAGEADSLVAHSTEEAREAFSTTSGWHGYANQIGMMAGTELLVLEETWKLRNGDCQYYRVASFSGTDDLILIRWILTNDGRISGIGLGPLDRAPPFDSETCGEPSGGR